MLKTKTLHLYYWAYMHMQANSCKDAVVFFIFDVETQMHADTISECFALLCRHSVHILPQSVEIIKSL